MRQQELEQARSNERRLREAAVRPGWPWFFGKGALHPRRLHTSSRSGAFRGSICSGRDKKVPVRLKLVNEKHAIFASSLLSLSLRLLRCRSLPFRCCSSNGVVHLLCCFGSDHGNPLFSSVEGRFCTETQQRREGILLYGPPGCCYKLGRVVLSCGAEHARATTGPRQGIRTVPLRSVSETHFVIDNTTTDPRFFQVRALAQEKPASQRTAKKRDDTAQSEGKATTYSQRSTQFVAEEGDNFLCKTTPAVTTNSSARLVPSGTVASRSGL